MHQSLNLFKEELRKGLPGSFNQLFTDYYQNLCRFAYTFVKDAELSEEIVQELFISIWEQRQTIAINTSIRAFLYTSVKNRSLNFLRNEKTRSNHEDQFAQIQNLKTDSIIDFLEREELNHVIEQAIKELPVQCRAIFELRQKQNLTNRDIANQLSLSVKTVENQINNAVKKLREKLYPYLSLILLFF
jgi:RNA polymerase sigma-70 factor (ECF subfamily)